MKLFQNTLLIVLLTQIRFTRLTWKCISPSIQFSFLSLHFPFLLPFSVSSHLSLSLSTCLSYSYPFPSVSIFLCILSSLPPFSPLTLSFSSFPSFSLLIVFFSAGLWIICLQITVQGSVHVALHGRKIKNKNLRY